MAAAADANPFAIRNAICSRASPHAVATVRASLGMLQIPFANGLDRAVVELHQPAPRAGHLRDCPTALPVEMGGRREPTDEHWKASFQLRWVQCGGCFHRGG